MDVTLVLTHDCNLGCGYCYAGAKFNKRMPAEIAAEALELAFSKGAAKVQISFFGGEPLIAWPMLVDVANEARERAAAQGAELKMSVTTNGTLLDRERAKILDDLGVYVGLSIDGIAEAHDSNRPKMGGGSSFDDVKRGLDVLLARGTPFETISVVTPQNTKFLGESVRFLIGAGVPRVGLNPCYEAAFTDSELDSYGQGLSVSADVMLECFRAGRIVSMPVFDNKILAALKGGLSEGDKCSLGDGSVAVAPSGNIYPCERFVAEDEDHTFVMGNVMTGFVPRGQQGGGEACERGPINPECEPCGERWRCASFCACANRAETGKTNVAGGTQCWHERTTGALADRIAETLWQEKNPWFLAWFYGRVAGLGAALKENEASEAAAGASKEAATAPQTARMHGPAGVIARRTPERAHLRVMR